MKAIAVGYFDYLLSMSSSYNVDNKRYYTVLARGAGYAPVMASTTDYARARAILARYAGANATVGIYDGDTSATIPFNETAR